MKRILPFILVAILWQLQVNLQAQNPHPANLNWTAPEDPTTGLRVDPDVFLQGDFVEVGVHPVGSFGTSIAAPIGFHPLGPNNWLGFVADPGKDGWASNVLDPTLPNQSGDYFTPGSPEESFSIEFDISGTEYNFQNAGLESAPYGPTSGVWSGEIPQTSLVNTSSGTTNSCVWIGTATAGGSSLLVEQEVTFEDDDLFFIINMKLTNNGPSSMQNVEYLRNFDPDQGQPIGCSHGTINYVVHQPGAIGSGDTALVVSEAYAPCGSIPGAYYAIDPRAVVSTEGFFNRDPDDILDSPVAPPPGAPVDADQAIAIAFRFAELGVGQSVTFQFAVILNEADLRDPGNVLPPTVPLSDYSVFIAFALMIIFVATIIRFRRMA